MAGVKQDFGHQYLDQPGTPPRIIWVPTEDVYEGPEVGDFLLPIPVPAPCTIPGRDANGGVQYAIRDGVKGTVTVSHVFAGPGKSELVVVDATDTGFDVQVQLATDAASNITSTGGSLSATVQGYGPSAALLLSQGTGDGTGQANQSPQGKCRSYGTRVAGVDLYLHAAAPNPIGPDPVGQHYAALHDLVNRLHVALRFNLAGSLRRGRGFTPEVENVSAGVGYVQSIQILMPIWERLPAAGVQRTTITETTP